MRRVVPSADLEALEASEEEGLGEVPLSALEVIRLVIRKSCLLRRLVNFGALR